VANAGLDIKKSARPKIKWGLTGLDLRVMKNILDEFQAACS
jgi:hypothetical protein